MRGTGTAGAVLALLLVASVGCKVATVRPLDEKGTSEAGPAPAGGPFDPVAFVDSIWQSEVVRALDAAKDVGTFGGSASGSPPVVVRGRGRVVSVDTRSRSGTATVALDGGANVVLQIGPVITGTAIRDALPALGFDRFVNQIQHADAGNELNARVERDVLQPLHRAGLRGRHVRFAGMASFAEGQAPTVTPVRLEVEEP